MGEPTLSWNLVSDVHELLEYQFMVNALQAGTIVAVMAGVVGWYMVLRRQSFAGHTIAVMAFPGASGAALAGLPGVLGYYLACGIAALTIGRAGGSSARGRGAESAAIGVVQVAGLAAGFLFLSLYSGVLEQLETLLFGTFLGIDRDQVLTLLAVAVVVLGALAIVGRPLLLASLDPELARARGIPVRALDVGFLLLLGLAVAATSQITGALLVFALLVAPPAAAQALTPRPGLSLALSVAFALLVTWVGLGISYFSIYPLGFFVTSLAFGLYVLCRLAHHAAARRARGGRSRAPAVSAGA
ncbi:MAG TPA: metal ABC transporter permease [Solirubrobacteraceae bacterium]|nr:metal ABC transporter permease [Solirubrobacteraceae bacterium]